MMQVELLASINSAAASSAASTANKERQCAFPSVETAAQVPLNKEILSPTRILKQAITPMNGKSNLLKFLNGSKSGVFKTIGDRIVVPMKVSSPSKKLSSSEDVKFRFNSTFRMAVPVTSSFPINSFSQTPKVISKTTPVNKQFKRSPLTDKHVIVKTEIDSEPNLETGDLNKFMQSVSKSVLYPLKTNNKNNDAWATLHQGESQPSIKPSSFKLEDYDDELTSLSWLSSDNKELLKTIRKCNPDDPGIGLSSDENDDENSNSKKLVFTASSPINPQNSSPGQAYDDFKYNPLCKPPYSFSCLIFMAIEDSYLKRLPVKDIYRWVCKHFPYYRSAPSGWKNSIRHNLSLNRCFKKADCGKHSPKGSLWCIDPAYRPNLVQALKRSPYYPYLHPTGRGQPLSLNNLANLLPGAHTGRVPSWTPTLPPSTLWADRDMASAALNLMGLRGTDSETSNKAELISNTLEEIFRDADWLSEDRHRQRCNSTESVGSEELVICGEAQDHTYAMAPPTKKRAKREDKRCKSPQSDKSAPDAAYEFESAELSDEIADIMEDVIVEDAEVEEDQSLFDSGFGSMKSFSIKEKQKSPKNVTKSKEREPGKGTLRIKPLSRPTSRHSKRKAEKSRQFPKANKDDSKSRNFASEKEEDQSLFDSANESIKSLTAGKKPSSLKKVTKSREFEVRKKYFTRNKLVNHSHSPCLKRKAPKSHQNAKNNTSPRTLASPSKAKMREKCSDVDSGKDSPKVVRTPRSRRLKQRSLRKTSKSNYHTRSSNVKLLGQQQENLKFLIRKRKRRRSLRHDATDDEEEIKLAAGSLMRLAGFLNSPKSHSKEESK